MVKQNAFAYGIEALDELRAGFVANDFNIQNLIVEITTTAAMHKVNTPSADTAAAQ